MKQFFNIPGFLAIIFICTGFYLLSRNIYKQFSWEKATGIVLEVKEKENSSNQFYPLVQFQLLNGTEVSTEIRQSSNRGYYEEGEEIPIIYPRSAYKDAEINSIAWVYGFPLIFLVIGIIVLVIPKDLWYVS